MVTWRRGVASERSLCYGAGRAGKRATVCCACCRWGTPAAHPGAASHRCTVPSRAYKSSPTPCLFRNAYPQPQKSISMTTRPPVAGLEWVEDL
ncbi:hypothetical protein FA95DRAFT_191852 [Auriscalpium vulgare]|uniref:Uncharacterized protein n=1 Tax=Auriscalpium vulgare TaxID=40419 RepID=A0ACB8S6D4_9AGAM|nr:hypothetical protein FA95DRAFT_191852 [Auriscalpium vulgare]